MPLVRKVIDSNVFRSPLLRDYLSATTQNQVAITDYAWMEAYKGDIAVGIFESMAIVAEFPRQVVLLKNTGDVSVMSGKSAGLRRRLIDNRQSDDFPQYCRDLALAKAGDTRRQQRLRELADAATEHLESRLIRDARNFPLVIEHLAACYTPDELVALRGESRYSKELFMKMMTNVMHISSHLYHDLLPHLSFPDRDELRNSFVFRAALCHYLLAIDWINRGGAKAAVGALPSKLRNDFVDANFAAYATYFDGLLSKDAKTKRIYREALCLLDGIGANVSRLASRGTL